MSAKRIRKIERETAMIDTTHHFDFTSRILMMVQTKTILLSASIP
jgi:hypothetical protein